MSNDSIKKTLFITLGICLVCSLLVSSAAVFLKPFQIRNREMDRIQNILTAGDLTTEGRDIKTVFHDNIRADVIHLPSGISVLDSLPDASLHPDHYDIKSVMNDSRFSHELPGEADPANIHRIPDYAVIYAVIDSGETLRYILPVYGKGLWSTMYGFVALDRNLKTILGLTFYEHGETPGLGGEIDNPGWKALWRGKQAFDAEGNLAIEVIKGKVDPYSARAAYQVDGLSGSTLTTRGVNHMIRYWIGDVYRPFIDHMKKGNH